MMNDIRIVNGIKDPLYGDIRMCFFGGGGGGIPDPKPIPVAPTRVEPEVVAAKQNLREKMLRAQGRAASREQQPGFLTQSKTQLKDKLA